MDDLIKALQIFRKYNQSKHPTTCEHDTLYVLVDPKDVSKEDIKELESLGFFPEYSLCSFYSFRFGSA